jgi:hypothetical protein
MSFKDSYSSYRSNFGNGEYEIYSGAEDNQLECLKTFGKASIVGQHDETLEWIVEFDHDQIGRVVDACFFTNKEDANAFTDFHNLHNL